MNKVLVALDNLCKANNKEVTQAIIKYNGVFLLGTVLKAQDTNRSIVKKTIRILKQVSK